MEEEPSTSGEIPQGEDVPQVFLYNHNMMKFLISQLKKLEMVKRPQKADQADLDDLDKSIDQGKRLLTKHCGSFDICEFYRVEEARDGIQDICKNVNAVLCEWQARCSCLLEERIPEQCVDDDKLHLRKLLTYVLRSQCLGMDGTFLEQFDDVKLALGRKLDLLEVHVVDESEIHLIKEIGEGGWGVVYEADWPGKACKVAVKRPKGTVAVEELATLIKEAAIQASLQDPNIVQLHGYTPSGWLVMELADTNLHSVCYGQKKLGWGTKWTYAKQAASGLCFIHSQKHVHSDVKPANLLVFGTHSDGAQVKVADFGLSFKVSWDRWMSIRKGGGTPLYTAPEASNGVPLDSQSDTFSFGVTMFEVMSAKPPYRCPNIFGDPQAVMLKKKHVGEDPCEVKPEDCPKQMLELMRRCCHPDPQQRPTMKDVVVLLQCMPRDAMNKAPSSRQQDSTGLASEDAQKSGGRNGPASLTVNVKVEKHDLSDVQCDEALLTVLNRTLVRLFIWLIKRLAGDDIVVQIKKERAGCVVLPVEVECPTVHSVGLLKQQIQEGCTLLFQGDLYFLAHQPRLELGFDDVHYVADGKVAELENKLRETISKVSEVVDMKYSTRVMGFLQTEIRRLAECSFKLPDEAAAQNWKEDAAIFLHNLKLALFMLKQHTSVDIHNLYKSTDARVAVERILTGTASFVSEWGLHETVELRSAVPAELVQQDKEILQQCLGYAIEHSPYSFKDFTASCRQEWARAKQSLSEKIQKVAVVPDQVVRWHNVLDADVHLAEWNGNKVAAKQVMPVSKNGIDVEDYLKFYTWTFNRTILDQEHVVRLLGITRWGAVLMELADDNLIHWCASQSTIHGQGSNVAMKVRALHQAAEALHAVHCLGVVYGYLNSSKFLVFRQGDGDVLVKIAQLKLSAEPWEQDTRSSWTGRWMAKELYDGRGPSIASDVYSFGAVMYEVMMQELPYGRDATEAELMHKKLEGLQPFVVPESSKQEWPKGLFKLMKRCCSSEPEQRPSMTSVCSSLKALSCEQGPSTCPSATASSLSEGPSAGPQAIVSSPSEVQNPAHPAWIFALRGGLIMMPILVVLLIAGLAQLRGTVNKAHLFGSQQQQEWAMASMARSPRIELYEERWVAVPTGRFDNFVSITGRMFNHACNGILIKGSWVLTTATCIQFLGPNLRVYAPLGAGRFAAKRVVDSIPHPKWNGRLENGWNAMLLHLDQSLNAIGPTLAAPSLAAYNWTQLIVVELQGRPRFAKIPVIPNHLCSGMKALLPHMMCIGPVPSRVSQGSSGGPALIIYTPAGPSELGPMQMGGPELELLVGLVSHRLFVNHSYRATVVQKIADIQSWIFDVVSEENIHRDRGTGNRQLHLGTDNKGLFFLFVGAFTTLMATTLILAWWRMMNMHQPCPDVGASSSERPSTGTKMVADDGYKSAMS